MGCCPRQPCAGSDTEHSALLRATVPFSEGRAPVLVFPLTRSNTGEVGKELCGGRGAFAGQTHLSCASVAVLGWLLFQVKCFSFFLF